MCHKNDGILTGRDVYQKITTEGLFLVLGCAICYVASEILIFICLNVLFLPTSTKNRG